MATSFIMLLAFSLTEAASASVLKLLHLHASISAPQREAHAKVRHRTGNPGSWQSNRRPIAGSLPKVGQRFERNGSRDPVAPQLRYWRQGVLRLPRLRRGNHPLTSKGPRPPCTSSLP